MSISNGIFPDTMLICDACGEEICWGDPSYSLFRGRAGVGPKSGQPMVVDDPAVQYPVVNLHLGCLAEFSFKTDDNQNLSDETVAEMREALVGEPLCAACEAKLE